eukprot:g6390.t1
MSAGYGGDRSRADQILAQPDLLRKNDEWRNDKELMLQVLARQGQLLRHCSEALKSDVDVVLTAVKNDGDAVQFAEDFADEALHFVLKVVNIKGDAIRHAWHTLWEDHELILAAAKKDPRAIRHAGKASWNNRDFVLGMVTKNWRDLRSEGSERSDVDDRDEQKKGLEDDVRDERPTSCFGRGLDEACLGEVPRRPGDRQGGHPSGSPGTPICGRRAQGGKTRQNHKTTELAVNGTHDFSAQRWGKCRGPCFRARDEPLASTLGGREKISDALVGQEDPEIVYWAYQQDERAAEQYASASVFAERSFALAAAGVKVPPEWDFLRYSARWRIPGTLAFWGALASVGCYYMGTPFTLKEQAGELLLPFCERFPQLVPLAETLKPPKVEQKEEVEVPVEFR